MILAIIYTLYKIAGVPWTWFIFDKYIKYKYSTLIDIIICQNENNITYISNINKCQYMMTSLHWTCFSIFLHLIFKCGFSRIYFSICNQLVTGKWLESFGKLPDDFTIIYTISKLEGPLDMLDFWWIYQQLFSIIWYRNLFVTLSSANDTKNTNINLKIYCYNCFSKKGKIYEEKFPLDMVIFITL